MKCTYLKVFHGTHEAVEAAVRKFDKVFRQVYNVYGGRREYSGKDADNNYEVIMSYTVIRSDLTGARIRAIDRRFDREVYRLPLEYSENFWCDTIKEKN